MPTLFEQSAIGSLELANRFVASATWRGLADADGGCTDRLIDAVVEVVAGGAGLVISEFAFVSRDGQASNNELGVYDDALIPGLRRLAESAHDAGGRIVLQLVHGGLHAEPRLTGREPIGPSPFGAAAGSPGREMTSAEIEGIVEAFGGAARRAKAAGFDGVEIHAAHGFLLSQFLSPFYNNRSDKYGGTVENRARFLLEAIAAVREAVGRGFPLLVKLNATDSVPGGIEADDVVAVARLLEEAGVDAIEISGGTRFGFDVRNPDITFSPVMKGGVYYESAANRCKETVSIPLILDGGIRSLAESRRLVEQGIAGYVGSVDRRFESLPS